MRTIGIGAAVAVGLVFSGCGGDEGSEPSPGDRGGAIEERLKEARQVTRADFPPAGARSLEEIANTVEAGPQVGLATSVHTTGRTRIAFGLVDASSAFVYGRSAVYLAPTPRSKAQGPFPAPLETMVPAPRFRSRTVARDRAAPKAIYATEVPLRRPGRYALVVVSKVGGRLIGATARLTARRRTPIPAPGERPPSVETPTVGSVGGDIGKIETRVPPDSMHLLNFKEVIGERPAALLFATPALCASRTCGPVVDLAEQLKAVYGKRMSFVHQEVYVDNDPNRGLRPQLRAFGLETEPWLFTFDRQGRVAARLEGAFGLGEFRRAIEAALR